jgi:predicted aconitase with swiveling domain
MKQFKGRVLFGGNWKGEAVVSRQGFNTLASFQKTAMKKKCKDIIIADQNNPDVYGRGLTGRALCLPVTIGSTTGGMLIDTVAKRGIAPAAFLFSEHIDSLAAAGIILANVWDKAPLIAIDELGPEFLASVQNGEQIEIKEDGTVVLL